MDSAHTWEKHAGVSATPVLSGARVHSDQQTPLLWHPALFREKSLEPLASGGWKSPYLSCRKGNGAERMGLPQCVPEESTLLCEPFMFCFQEKRGWRRGIIITVA